MYLKISNWACQYLDGWQIYVDVFIYSTELAMSITKVARQKVVMEVQGYIFSDCPKFGYQLDGEHARNGDHSW